MRPPPPPPRPHVLVFPFPTQGHITPLASLASFLASSGLMVTLVHSARSHSLLLRNNASITPSSLVRVAVVPDAVPLDEKIKLSVTKFYDSLPIMEKGLEELIQNLNREGHPPSCIISDNFLPWTQDVAAKFGIPRVEFWTGSATVFSIGFHLPQLIARGYLPVKSGAEETMIDFIPGLLPFPVADLPLDFLVDDISKPVFQFLCRAFSRSMEAERVLVHSFYDIERNVVDALRAQQIPIEPIGPLLPSVDGRSNNDRLSPSTLLRQDDACLGWLDAQGDSSVIYVSFGSVATRSVEEAQELALGLEASQQPFLWVIRPDAETGASSDILPEGFESRTKERSLIISWAPQLAVLAHPAVGGFLTHCGWNSTLESLWMGVPMIGCPYDSEQNTNLKCVIDLKVGMALEGLRKGVIKRDSVEAAVKALMQGEEGERARRRAAELREAARKAMEEGHSMLSLQKLVDGIKQMANDRQT